MRRAILVAAAIVHLGVAVAVHGSSLGPAPEDAVAAPRIVLVWFDPVHALPWGADDVRRDVAGILRSAGAEASWRIAAGQPGNEDVTSSEIPVIVLPSDPDSSRRGLTVMGLVRPQQEPPRAVWVFVRTVRQVLGLGRYDLAPSQHHLVQLALSRVIAHELMHAVSPAQPHAMDGLMAGSLTARFLVGPRPVFDLACVEAFRSGLARLSPGPLGDDDPRTATAR